MYLIKSEEYQRGVPLASGLLFYCLGGVKSVIFVLITAASTIYKKHFIFSAQHHKCRKSA